MNKRTTLRKPIIFISFLLFFSFPVLADSQWDITLNVPYYAGFSSSSGDIGALTDYLFLIPDIKWNYYFGSEKLHLGVGMRMWTLLIESALYPIISVESQLGNFVFNANIGGGVFLIFGLYNDVSAQPLFIPDVSVAYRFGKKKIFSIGTGATFFISPDSVDNAFVFIGTAFVRMTF